MRSVPFFNFRRNFAATGARVSKRETRTTTFDLGEIAARARFAAKAAAAVSRPFAAEIESIRGQWYFFLSCDLRRRQWRQRRRPVGYRGLLRVASGSYTVIICDYDTDPDALERLQLEDVRWVVSTE